jgi:hypothetical protein
MTADQLTDYLNDLRQLKSANEKELLALTKKHPYCQSLHYMMVRKAQMEYSVNYERLLHLASTYATDRAYLYQLIHREELQLQQEVAQADVLILNNIHDKKHDENSLDDMSEPTPVLILPSVDLVQKEEDTIMLEHISTPDILAKAVEIAPEMEQENIAIGAPESLAQNLELDDDAEELVTLDQLLQAKTEVETPEIVPTQIETNATIESLFEADQVDEYDSESEEELLTLDQISVVKTEPVLEEIPSYETFLAKQQAIEPKPSQISDDEEYELMTISDLNQNEGQASEPSAASNEIELELTSMNSLHAQPQAAETAIPMPKSSFSSWLRKFKKPELVDVSMPVESETDFVQYADKIDEKFKDKKVGKEKTKKKKKNADLIAFAEQSLIHNEEITSETLAQLLGEHGRKERAIHIYEKLMLHIPEKSLYFASEIERLKKSTV